MEDVAILILGAVVVIAIFLWLISLDRENDSFPESFETVEEPTSPKPKKSHAPKKKRKEIKRPNKKERAKVYKRVQKVYKKKGYTMTMRETEDFFDEYLLVLGVMWLASLPRGDEAFYQDMNENVDVAEYGSEVEDSEIEKSSEVDYESSDVDYDSDDGDSGGDD